MKGTNEFLGNENKSRFRKFVNILSAFDLDEIFPSSENDDDTKEINEWIDNEKKKINNKEYNNPNAQIFNISIYERPNQNDMQNQPQELAGINNINIDYKLEPKDVIDVSIKKLKEYADSLPVDKRDLQYQASDLAFKLAKMKWAISVLTGFKENPEGFVSQEAKNNFVVAQKILKDSIDISNNGTRKFDIRDVFNKFNKLDEFSHIKEQYCCIIDRFISTTESVAFELEELDNQIVEDNAYKDIQDRKIFSINKEKEFNDKLNNEIDTIITDGYDPESMYNDQYNNDYLLSINPIENNIKVEKEKLKEKEKELVDAKNTFKKNVDELIKEREQFDKSNSEIIKNLIKNEENRIKQLIDQENDEIDTNNQLIAITEERQKNINNEIAEIDKQAYVDEMNQFKAVILDCNENIKTYKSEDEKAFDRLKEIDTLVVKMKKGEVVLDDESKEEMRKEAAELFNRRSQLAEEIKTNLNMRNLCLDTLKIKKAYINKYKEINEKINIDELKESLTESEKLLAEKQENYAKKYSVYKEKYDNIKKELYEDAQSKSIINEQQVKQNPNEKWKPGKHSLLENYNYYSNKFDDYTQELEKLVEFAPKGYENEIYGHIMFMVDYKQFKVNYAPVICDFNGLDSSFFENPDKVSENINSFLNGDLTKEQEDFLNQPSNTRQNMTNREVMYMIADNYEFIRKNFILSQIDLKKIKENIGDYDFTSSDEYIKATKKADNLIKSFAKNNSLTVLQQMNDAILKNGAKLENNFFNLSKELYEDQKKQILQISNKYNSKIGEITSRIYNSRKLFDDPFEYFDPSSIEMKVNPEDDKSFISKVKVNTRNRFRLTTDRSILTSLAIGKILQNERISDKVKGRGKETKLYNDVFDSTINLPEKNKLAQEILDIYNKEDDNLCRMELANEMFKSLSVCVDIIDDRMYQLNGNMSAQTLLDPKNKYVLNIADVLFDIGQDIVKKGPDNKNFVDLLKEQCKTQKEKDNIDRIVEKAAAVAKVMGIHSKNLNTIIELANKDLSKGVNSGETSELFAAIERIKITEKFTKEEVLKDKNWNKRAGFKTSLKKNFSDILTEEDEFEVVKGNTTSKIKINKAEIIFSTMNSGISQLLSDKSFSKSLYKLEEPDSQGICGVNLLARNYLLNPNGIPDIDFKFDASTATIYDVNAKSFNNYIADLKLKKLENGKEMVNVAGQLQALKGIVNYNPLITSIKKNLEDMQEYDHFYTKYKMEKEMKDIYLKSVNNIMDKDEDEIKQAKDKVDSIRKTLENGKLELEDLNNQYESKIKSLPDSNYKNILSIRLGAETKKGTIETELNKKIKTAKSAIEKSKENIGKLKEDLANVKIKIENDRKGVIEEEIGKLKGKIEDKIKTDLVNINQHESEVSNYKTVIKNMEIASNKITDKTKDIGTHKAKLTNLKNEKIAFMKENKSVIDNSNNKIKALPNEKARVNQIKVGLADLYNSLEVARDKKHSDTPEFSRMKTALSAAMVSNSFEDMKSKLEEINAAAKNYITKKNSKWVPRFFASNMRIARLNAARNIEAFCKNKIETCKKYESPYNSEIESFVNNHQSQQVNNMINDKESFNIIQVFGDQFNKTVTKKMEEKNISKDDRTNMKNSVKNFAVSVNNECNENIAKEKNDNKTLYSNIEKGIPDKAKNIRDNIMQLKKAEINKLFNKNVEIKKNELKMDMVKA